MEFQLTQHESNMMSQLCPIEAERLDSDHSGPTRHPYFTSPEIRLLRTYALSGPDLNFDIWSAEIYVPYSDTSCIADDRQILRIRQMCAVR